MAIPPWNTGSFEESTAQAVFSEKDILDAAKGLYDELRKRTLELCQASLEFVEGKDLASCQECALKPSCVALRRFAKTINGERGE